MVGTAKRISIAFISMGLLALALAAAPRSDEPEPRPRPGLTAQQTKQAVKLAQGAMVELRKKTEGASAPGADVREYVVSVELLSRPEGTRPSAAKDSSPRADAEPGPGKPQQKEQEQEKVVSTLAVVTSYRYFDDITVFSTVDLATGRIVKVEAAQHLRTPLSEAEFDAAKELALSKSDEVKQLYDRFGDQLSVYPQFSQYSVKDDPRVHRVVHLTYRVGKRDLSYPRPQVDLTTRQLEMPAPEAHEPAPKSSRPKE
jgi:hypothetical protein